MKFVYLALSLVTVAISVGSSEIVSSFCEQQQVMLACQGDDEVLSITKNSTASYGPEAGRCSESAADVPKVNSSCFATPETIYQVVSGRCDNRAYCYFWAIDDLFGLNAASCPTIEIFDSQLTIVYECIKDLTTVEITTTAATAPIADLHTPSLAQGNTGASGSTPGSQGLSSIQGSNVHPPLSEYVTRPTLPIAPLISTVPPSQHLVTSEALLNVSVVTTTMPVPSNITSTEILTTSGQALAELTTTSEAPTSVKLLQVSPGACQDGERNVTDCYTQLCTKGRWSLMSIAYNDTNCCYMWGGCETAESVSNRPSTSTAALNMSSHVPTSPTSAGTIPTVSTECPPANSSYRDSVLVWPRTSPGLMRTADCPGDTQVPPSVARRLCRDSGEWAERIDTSRCIIPILRNITEQRVKTEGDLADLAVGLANVTESEELTLDDVNHVIAALDHVVAGKIEELGSTEVLNITKDVLQVGDNLLNTISEQEETTRESNKSMEVVAVVEKVSLGAAGATNSSIRVKSQSIELFVEVVDLGKEDNPDRSISIETKGGSISFPVTNLPQEKEGSDLGKLVTLFYTNQTDLWDTAGNLTVGSALLSVSMLDSTQSSARRQLDAPFSFSLSHEEATSGDSYCMFWEQGRISRWSGEGCRRVDSSDNKTACECSHLTNFAVLLDTTGELKEGPFGLTVITYVGCGISIACLFLAWLTFQCLKNLSSDRNTIHKHLVFNLMVAEILFLVAISSYAAPLKIFCAVLAGVLHFLFLCVFAWTCLEGVQLYIMLIEVFEAERSRTLYYYLAGYGVPALIVGVSAAIKHQGYGGPHVCWLDTDSGFIWSFAGPVAAVMLTNTVMLGVAIYMMYRHAKMVANMKHKETSKLDNARAWIKGAIVLLVLLGLTWISGFMYVNKDTIAIAYIFTVLNSLQGLFIFTFHCLKNEKVQKEYKRYVRRAQWLPTCIRIRYGEHKGLTNVPSHSSSSSGYLSKYFSKRRKSSSDLTSGSVRLKKQISNLTSVNSHLEETFESKEPLTVQHKISFDAGYNEEQRPLNSPGMPETLC